MREARRALVGVVALPPLDLLVGELERVHPLQVRLDSAFCRLLY